MPARLGQPPSRPFDPDCFSERARQVIVSAAEEARMVGRHVVGTEHLLLGLLREEEGQGARVMRSLGVSDALVAASLGQAISLGGRTGRNAFELSPRARAGLSLAVAEAEALGTDIAATHHVLLGLLADEQCTAVRVLLDIGLGPDQLRGQVLAGIATAPQEWPASGEQLQAFRNRPRDNAATSTKISDDVRLSMLRAQIQTAHVALQQATTDRQRYLAREETATLNSLVELMQHITRTA